EQSESIPVTRPSLSVPPPCRRVVIACLLSPFFFFLFNDPSPTEISTLSLHDALPIFRRHFAASDVFLVSSSTAALTLALMALKRSEEYTSELQSRFDLVCRLLLKKKDKRQ